MNPDNTMNVIASLVQHAHEFHLDTIASQLKIRAPDALGHKLQEIFNLVHDTPKLVRKYLAVTVEELSEVSKVRAN